MCSSRITDNVTFEFNQTDDISCSRLTQSTSSKLQKKLAFYECELAEARKIQLALLPKKTQYIDDFLFTYQSFSSSYLTGDFVDYFHFDDRYIGFYLLDVSGHGTSAALIAVLIKSMITSFIDQLKVNHITEFLPSELLSTINQGLIRYHLGKHATAIVGRIDTKKNSLSYGLAGNLPRPIWLENKSDPVYLTGNALPLGLFNDAVYTDYVMPLAEQFKLILLSDGVFDVIDANTLLEKEEKLLALIKQAGGSPTQLQEIFKLHPSMTVLDDITFLVLSRSQ